jgi:hypothetical protein
MPFKKNSDSGFGQGFGQLMNRHHDHFDKMAKQMFGGFGSKVWLT